MALQVNLLSELKSILLREQKNVEENLSKIAKVVDKTTGDYEASFDDIGPHREDNATEVEQYADNLPVELTLEKKLQDILDALKKMEEGSYGICEKCKAEINIERLKVNPSARTCTQCKLS